MSGFKYLFIHIHGIYQLGTNDYWYNALNQQVRKLIDGKDSYTQDFDYRGNLTQVIYHRNNGQRVVMEQYNYSRHEVA